MARNEAVAKAQREKFVEAARKVEAAGSEAESEATKMAGNKSENERQPPE